MTYIELINSYGHPFLSFEPDSTRNEEDLPTNIVVYKNYSKHNSKILVFAEYNNDGDYHRDEGEKWVIKYLLDKME